MDIGTGGTGGTCPPPLFTNLFTKCPLSAYIVPYFACEGTSESMCPHFLNASYFPVLKGNNFLIKNPSYPNVRFYDNVFVQSYFIRKFLSPNQFIFGNNPSAE